MLDFLPYIQPCQEVNYYYKPAQEIAINVGEGCGHQWLDEDKFNSLKSDQAKWDYKKNCFYLLTKVKRVGSSDQYEVFVECLPCDITNKSLVCNSKFPKTEIEVKKRLLDE